MVCAWVHVCARILFFLKNSEVFDPDKVSNIHSSFTACHFSKNIYPFYCWAKSQQKYSLKKKSQKFSVSITVTKTGHGVKPDWKFLPSTTAAWNYRGNFGLMKKWNLIFLSCEVFNWRHQDSDQFYWTVQAWLWWSGWNSRLSRSLAAWLSM